MNSPWLARVVPGMAIFSGYRRQWLVRDLIAGVTVCIVMIPSVIAYSRLMGLPPENGLYAALVPLFIYPFFGSSRQLILGPDIAISLLMASQIGALAAGDQARACTLAAAMALLSGVILFLGARAKIGAVANFLSKPVLVGYMSGAALILVASQLGSLLGVPLRNNDFFPRVIEVAGKLPQAQKTTLVLGVVLLAVLFGLHRFAPKLPAALVVCVLGVAACISLGLESRGVTVVGTFRSGLPRFALPILDWHELTALLPAVIGISLLTYAEGILLARAFAAKNGYEVSATQELTALGLADVGAGLFQGFAITGSQARTTVNDNAGGKTQLVSLAAAATLVLFLLFLTPLLAHLPTVALGAILIYGGFSLVEFDALKRIYRCYPRAAVSAALTTLAVLAAGVILGILFGVVLSLLGLINRVSHPPDAVLREVPGHGFHDPGGPFDGPTVPGLIAYRFYAPLLFSNCNYFAERVRHVIGASSAPVQWFLLDAQAITDIDVTAVETLRDLRRELREKRIVLKIAHANPPLRELLRRTGLAREIGHDGFFDSVHKCIEAFQRQHA
ncbi:MAG: sulfate transporter [Verrucomicrobia bacterium]|nr:MAG: sulfate transporter [Verrucomicrobiota bacterium]